MGIYCTYRGGLLLAQRFDTERLRLEGESRVIGQILMPPEVTGTYDTPFAVSRNGVLALRDASNVSGQLVWLDREGRELGRVTQPQSGEFVNPTLSPDGRTIAVNRREPATGNLDTWLIEVETNRASRLTTEPTPEVDRVWSPDGERIAFTRHRNGKAGLWVKSVDGGDEELLFELPGEDQALLFGARNWQWSRDGELILLEPGWAVPVDGDQEPWNYKQVAGLSYFWYAPRLSPDGQWLVYSSNETGLFELYMESFPDGRYWKPISVNGGAHARRGDDPTELFFWGGSSGIATLMRVELQFGPTGFRAGVPEILFAPRIAGTFDGRHNHAVSRDGQRFLLRRPSLDPPPVTVIWTAELESR